MQEEVTTSYENTTHVSGGGLGFMLIIYLAILGLLIAGMWKLFQKAGKPGWAAIVPIYNIIVLLEIVGKPLWWIVLYIIPFANIYALIVVNDRLAKSFGKDTGFTVGLILLAPIFYPILGFGDAQYHRLPDSVPATGATTNPTGTTSL